MKVNERRAMKNVQITTRSKKEGNGNVAVGYAAVFNSPTDIGGMFKEVIAPGAFKRALATGNDVCCLMNHNWEKILGRTKSETLKLEEDQHGLKFEVDLPNTTDGTDLIALMERGDISQCSFGFRIVDESWDHSVVPSLRTIHEVELYEVSIVTIPAYEDTEVSLTRSAENMEYTGGNYLMRKMVQQNNETRKKFGNYLAGKILLDELRSLGIDFKNGKVLVPTVIANEIIGYTEQENLLRKFGTVVPLDEQLQYPVLIESSDVQVHVNAIERTETIPVNSIGLKAEILKPVEFDSLSRIKKRLLKMNVNVADLILNVMKKEYVKKEIDYMFNGTGAAYNEGSLYNRAVVFTSDGTDKNKALRDLSKKPSTAVRNNARWFVNDAGLELAETITLPNGEAALKTLENSEAGVKYTFFGYPLHCVDAVKGTNEDSAVFYFGDMSSFVIQDNSTGLEIEISKEMYAHLNEVGYKLYNLLDGKLIYSDLEPTVYRYEI